MAPPRNDGNIVHPSNRFMKTDRWTAIKTIFQDALSYAGDQRTEFLTSACGDDNDLLSEITSMLAHHDQAGAFLESPDTLTNLKIGKHLGPYRIVRFISQGGMGEVYEAVRDDGEYSKRVAIKFVKDGWGIQDLLKRFQHERQALANLEHPNIARLLDGGTTDDGLPYLVMEYVQGVPIDEYCDEHTLSIDDRLKLFRTICSAVHYAHQHLIVHRDLKPGNILVNTVGAPTLLDFGIAKILNSDASVNINVTRTGVRFITLEYASPEQIRGETITTASDVYSLGVLLFNLLTGQRPYRFTSNLPHDVSRIVCEEEPQRPSVAIVSGKESASEVRNSSPEKLRRLLTGDLDNIVLKALQKDPRRRYASAEQLAEDILRHLNGVPVLAAKDSMRYRTAKFIQRHKSGAAMAAVFALFLLGSMGAILWQARIAGRERDKARMQTAKAEKINAFLEEMLTAANPFATNSDAGKNTTVAEALHAAAERVDTELGDQKELDAAIRTTIGRTYISLGSYGDAEKHLQKALEIRQQLFGSEHADVAESLHLMALLRDYQGDFAATDSLYRLSISIYRRLAEPPAGPFAETLSDYGTHLQELGEHVRAIALFDESLPLAKKAFGMEHPDVATVLNNVALSWHRRGDLQQAERYYQASLDMRYKLFGKDNLHVSNSYNNLSIVRMDQKNYRGAEEMLRKTLEIRRKKLGEDHTDMAAPLHNLALSVFKQQRPAEAESLEREAIRIAKKTLGKEHPTVAFALTRLGRFLNERKSYKEAETTLRQALHIRTKGLPSNHYLIAITRSELGRTFAGQKRYSEAETLLVQSYDQLKAALGEQDPMTQEAGRYLAELRSSSGKKAGTLSARK